MELVEIKKRRGNLAEIRLRIADTEKKYSFKYYDNDIFAVDFPEELRKILRLIPASVTHSLVEKIRNFLASNLNELPFKVELEKEILQLV